MRNVCTLTCALVLCALFLLPSITFAQGAKASSFNDGSGHEVQFGLNPQRIVTLAPNVTEMLYFLGHGDRHVGRTEFCNYPPEAASVPSIGGFADTSLESIVALQPDLVIAYQGNSLELVWQLREAGIMVVAFKEAATLRGIANQMATLDRVITGPSNPEAEVVSEWRLELSELTEDVPETGESFLFGYPGETTYTCSPATFISDMIGSCGLASVISDDVDERWLQVSGEFIIAAQPQWIITGAGCTAEECPFEAADKLTELRRDPVWASLPAVQSGQLIVVQSDLLLRPGPRVLDAIRQIQSQMKELQRPAERKGAA